MRVGREGGAMEPEASRSADSRPAPAPIASSRHKDARDAREHREQRKGSKGARKSNGNCATVQADSCNKDAPVCV